MNKSSWVFLVLMALLVACACIAGCSDSSSSTSTSAQTAVTTSPVSSSAHYVAGDIVKNPKSSSTAAVLIIGYDAGTDMYERAYIYPNSDGSWGYRVDANTAKVSRSIIEEVYTDKVRNIAVSAVPIGTPTTAATLAATYSTITTTATTMATTATTTSTASAPRVTDITPFAGQSGTTVSITELDGQNFQSGTTVALVKSGESSIAATGVGVTSANIITCTFVIPSGTTTGYWDILVTNPDGQFYQYQTAFNILEGSGTTTTTTTSSAVSTSSRVTIIQIQDTLLVTGGTEGYKTVTILGTNLTAASNMKLTGPSTITGTTYSSSSATMATGYFTIPAGNTGNYYVTLVDSSGTVLATSSNTLTIQ